MVDKGFYDLPLKIKEHIQATMTEIQKLSDNEIRFALPLGTD
jgi:hypothetical protein